MCNISLVKTGKAICWLRMAELMQVLKDILASHGINQ